MIDTKRLRRVGHAVGVELGHNAGEVIKAAAGTIDALTALAASKTEQCSALRSELEALRTATNPELLASERAANAVLTSEVERLTRALRVAALALAHATQEHGAIYQPAYKAVDAALSQGEPI